MSIHWSVRPSIHPLVHRLVCNAFVKIAENGVMQDGDASYVVYTALLISEQISYRPTDRWMGGQTSGWMDTPTDRPSYEDARTPLKIEAV